MAKLNREAAERQAQTRRAEEEEHKAEINWLNPVNWNWTAVATCVIAIFTILIWCVGINQWRTFQGQLNVLQGQLAEMQSEQRPWIYADIGPGGRIFSNQSGGLTFPVAFKFHNTGHLPAMYVSPDIDGYLSGEGGVIGSLTVQERQRKRCGLPLQQPSASDQIGVTVFPGQSVLFGTSIGITADEIGEVRKLEQRMGMVSDFFPSPWGTGCIRYRSPDGAFHQTGVAFTISMAKPGNEGTFVLSIDPTSIDPQNLIIQRWIEGGTAYAN